MCGDDEHLAEAQHIFEKLRDIKHSVSQKKEWLRLFDELVSGDVPVSIENIYKSAVRD